MSPKEAQRVLEALANGIDPETGEVFQSDSVLDYPSVIRALFLGAKALDRISRSEESKEAKALPMAGKSWTPEGDQQLLQAFDAGKTVEQLSHHHGRTRSGIAARLVRLGRIDERSEVYVKARHPSQPEEPDQVPPRLRDAGDA